jgi:hypothetical protein
MIDAKNLLKTFTKDKLSWLKKKKLWLQKKLMM